MDQGFRVGQDKRAGFVGVLAAFSCIVICVFLVTTAALIAAEEAEMPEEIYIENKVYKTDRKGPIWGQVLNLSVPGGTLRFKT